MRKQNFYNFDNLKNILIMNVVSFFVFIFLLLTRKLKISQKTSQKSNRKAKQKVVENTQNKPVYEI